MRIYFVLTLSDFVLDNYKLVKNLVVQFTKFRKSVNKTPISFHLVQNPFDQLFLKRYQRSSKLTLGENQNADYLVLALK